MEDLLPQVAQYISERFGFYQVGIFFLDELGEYAELKAANSEGGKRMLARGHKLRVGQEGIVGYVTSTGEVRIALDVGQDAVHFDTPELPETRSEMALPLFSGGRLFGALDVQSTEPNAFGEDDVLTMRVLADQVSMAINNALLFGQLQTSLEAERRAYGEITQKAWYDLLQLEGDWGYKFDQTSLARIGGKWSEDMAEATSTMTINRTEEQSPVLVIPIRLYGNAIGAIKLTKPEGSIPWTDDEVELIETLAERLTQSLESARLYQETQKRAAQEQIISQITGNIRKSMDIDAVLRAAAREFGEVFNAEEVVIRMDHKKE
jgi:GAF domain-containing protein